MPSELVQAMSTQQNTHERSRRESVAIAAQRGILAVEIPPFVNGPVRYGTFLAVLAATQNVPLSAGVLATTTFALEGGAGVAMAHVLDRDDSVIVEKVGTFLDKFLKEGANISPIAEVGIANYLGTPAVLMAKQKANPERTLELNRRHGLLTGAWLAGACAVQGVLIGEGVTDPTNPKVVLPAIGILAATSITYNRIKNRIHKRDKV